MVFRLPHTALFLTAVAQIAFTRLEKKDFFNGESHTAMVFAIVG